MTRPASAGVDQAQASAVEQAQRREKWRRRLPLLPALVFVIITTQIPFVLSLYYSLTDWNILSADPREFIGLGNYGELFTNQFFLESVWVSVLMTVGAVLLSVALGTGFALLLDRKFFGQGIVRTLIITPFLIMPVVAGLIWSNQMFNSTFGVVNWFIGIFGIPEVAFVSRYPVASIIAVLVWQWAPFMMLIVLAGLQSQPNSVLEAARVDGASRFAIFSQITLPHLRTYLELGILLGSIYLIQVFDQIQVMTNGTNSRNVPFFVFQRSIGGGWEFGEASAYSVVVVLASIGIATFCLRVLSRLLDDES